MAKKRKTRKRYRGKDSSLPPQVIRVEAPERTKLGNWWHDNKQNIIIRLVQIGATLIVGGLIWWVAS